MAFNQHGLDYTIKVKDAFSAATAKFRADIEEARAAFAALKVEMAAGVLGSPQDASVRAKTANADLVAAKADLAEQGRARRREVDKEFTRALKEEANDRKRIHREFERSLSEELRAQKAAGRSKAQVVQTQAKAQVKAAKEVTAAEREAGRAEAARMRSLPGGGRDPADVALRRADNAAFEREVDLEVGVQGLDLAKRSNAQVALRAQAEARVRTLLAQQVIEQRKAQLLSAQGLGSDGLKDEEAVRRSIVRLLERTRRETERLRQLEAQGLGSDGLKDQEATRRTIVRLLERTRRETERLRQLQAEGLGSDGLRDEEAARRSIAKLLERTRRETQRLRQLEAQGLGANGLTAQAEAARRVASALRQARVEQERMALLRGQQLSPTGRTPGQAAALSVQRALAAQREAVAEISLRRQQGLAVSPELLNRASGSILRMNRGLAQTNNLVGRLGPSLQRVAAAILVFGTLRLAVQGFQALVRESVTFNTLLERAEISSAGLILSATQLRDVWGQALTPAASFGPALALASKQSKGLRQDALDTAASFNELLSALQVSIAPGLSQGLGLNEIRRVTVLISQAATALGLQQNQLAEEIRSILQGTINIRNTRIAAALNLTNSQVRSAQEQGRLYEFLTERLGAFGLTADRVAGSVSGLGRRISDIFQQVAGEAGAGAFEELRTTMQAVFDTLRGTGSSLTNPQAVSSLLPIFESLSRILRDVRSGIEDIDFSRFRDFVEDIGGLLETTFKLGTAFFKGLAKAIADFGAIASLGGGSFEGLAQLAGTFTGLALTFGPVLAGVGALAGVLRRLRTVFTTLRVAGAGMFAAVRVGAGATLGPIGLVISAAFALYTVFDLVRSAIGSVPEAVQASVLSADKLKESFGNLDLNLEAPQSLVRSGLADLEEVLSNTVQELQKAAVALEVARRGRETGTITDETTTQSVDSEFSVQRDLKGLERARAQVLKDLNTTREFFRSLDTRAGSVLREDDSGAFLRSLGKLRKGTEDSLKEESRLKGELAEAQKALTLETREQLDLDAAERLERPNRTAQLQEEVDAILTKVEAIRKVRKELAQGPLDVLETRGVSVSTQPDARGASLFATKRGGLRDPDGLVERSEIRRATELLGIIKQTGEAVVREVNAKSRLASIAQDELVLQEALKALQKDQAALSAINAAARMAPLEEARREVEAAREILNLRKQLIGLPEGSAQAEFIQTRIVDVEVDLTGDERRSDLYREHATLKQQINALEGRSSEADQAALKVLQDALPLTQARLILLEKELGIARKLKQVDDDRKFILAQGSFSDGIQLGINDFAEGVKTAAELGQASITAVLQTLGSGLGNVITTALGKGDVEQAMLGLLDRVFSSVLDVFIADLIAEIAAAFSKKKTAEAVVDVVSLTTAGAGGAQGGHVEPLTHKGAKGYSKGGRVRRTGQAGRDPRDTIAAFLRPNEFVLRPEAVSALGVPLLDAFNALGSGSDRSAFARVGNRQGPRSIPSATRASPTAQTPARQGSQRTHSFGILETTPGQRDMIARLSKEPYLELIRNHSGEFRRALGF